MPHQIANKMIRKCQMLFARQVSRGLKHRNLPIPEKLDLGGLIKGVEGVTNTVTALDLHSYIKHCTLQLLNHTWDMF